MPPGVPGGPDDPGDTPPLLHGRWRQPWEYLIEHPEPAERITTGIPTLDAATGGGIPVSGLVTLQGSPGAGKTSLAIQWGARAALGCVADVWMVMPDEGARGACVRVGQNLGFDRRKIESDDPDVMAHFGMKLIGAGGIRTLDPDDPAATLEAILESIEYRARRGDGLSNLLILDSTQTVVTGQEFDGDRARVTYVMGELKKAARRLPLLVLNISQLNRSAYRHKNPEDNANPLSGGAESRAIEFQSDLVLHLDGDVQAIVTARVVKNRFHRGEKPGWSMRYDVERAQFTEIDVESDELRRQREKEQAEQTLLERTQEDVMGYLRKRRDLDGGWVSTKAVEQGVDRTAAVIRRALKGLLAAGDIEQRDGAKNAIQWRSLRVKTQIDDQKKSTSTTH